MKKAISLALVIMLCMSVMTGCCLSHEWVEADCLNPKFCAKCDKTEGEALGHDWTNATCLNPKTCRRCSETEGDALGHDWAEADCVNPETCSRCSKTEGEALGHSYTGWTATEANTMYNSCTVCGETQEEPLDREFIGRSQLIGKWVLTSATVNEIWFDLSLGWTLEFYEDGTFDFQISEVESGEIEYQEFYDGEHMDFYVFDGNTEESTYSFNYEPVEDVLYIIGSEYFKFVRVTE